MTLKHRLFTLAKVANWPIIIRKPIVKLFLSRKKITRFPYLTKTATGILYRGEASDLIDYHVLSRGSFEPGLSMLLKDWAEDIDNSCFVDIGANSGLHVAFLSKFYRVCHAFEPYPPLFDKLTESLRLNGASNVNAHPLALGSSRYESKFAPPVHGNSGTGRLKSEGSTSSSDVTVEVYPGDTLLRDEKRISAIKIDVEGLEMDVIRGLQGTVKEHRPLIAFEVLNNEANYFSELEKLFPQDYLFFEILNIKSKNYRLAEKNSAQGDFIAIPKEKAAFTEGRG